MYQNTDLVVFAMLSAAGTGLVVTPTETPYAGPKPIVPRAEAAREAYGNTATGWSGSTVTGTKSFAFLRVLRVSRG